MLSLYDNKITIADFSHGPVLNDAHHLFMRRTIESIYKVIIKFSRYRFCRGGADCRCCCRINYYMGNLSTSHSQQTAKLSLSFMQGGPSRAAAQLWLHVGRSRRYFGRPPAMRHPLCLCNDYLMSIYGTFNAPPRKYTT